MTGNEPELSWERVKTEQLAYRDDVRFLVNAQGIAPIRNALMTRNRLERVCALRALRDLDPSYAVEVFDLVLWDALYIQGWYLEAWEVISRIPAKDRNPLLRKKIRDFLNGKLDVDESADESCQMVGSMLIYLNEKSLLAYLTQEAAKSADPDVREAGTYFEDRVATRIGPDFGQGQAKLPEGFAYPAEFCRIMDLGLTNLEPWHMLADEALTWRFDGLRDRYPSRQLVPFCRRQDNDDVACFDMAQPTGTVAVIHDFAEPGWEQRATYNSIYDWLQQAVQDMIAFDTK